MRKWRGETKFNNENSDTENENSETDNEDPATTTPTTPERENTAKSSTNDPENNENSATTGHQPTIANASNAVEPINGANTEVQQTTETTVENLIQTAPAEANEITPPVVLPEEPQDVFFRSTNSTNKQLTIKSYYAYKILKFLLIIKIINVHRTEMMPTSRIQHPKVDSVETFQEQHTMPIL
ncbi:hypothetical protein DAPPUDRAFT_334575 [Daphnia pulex]|uniref:Uncharacterized protein n=1 Tax=Daphnia pulex TaxID=6669 RepID=E9HVW0_DAPPU|nr:hypothetical protein DAPPUDRAFT_334575 [Daphnia pulex]|eukprot:EFX64120.1 hypothetical protein DAPPUDRAFT_334575 [Daphnia pulex]